MPGPVKLAPIVVHSKIHSPPPLPAIRAIGLAQPLRWLVRGWEDMRHGGWLSLVHGLVPAGFGALLLLFARDRFWLLAGAFSGFLMVAPVLATSLYPISRALERGEAVDLRLIIKTWTRWQRSRDAVRGGYWRLDFLRHVVLAPHAYLFELWLTLGGLMAVPIFVSSVISMPLLLDRRVDVLQAVLTNPVPLSLWAALIMGLSLLGFGTLMAGLIVLLPLMGHASWHAYRDVVDAVALPERLGPVEVA